jgi:hypothetical protein
MVPWFYVMLGLGMQFKVSSAYGMHAWLTLECTCKTNLIVATLPDKRLDFISPSAACNALLFTCGAGPVVTMAIFVLLQENHITYFRLKVPGCRLVLNTKQRSLNYVVCRPWERIISTMTDRIDQYTPCSGLVWLFTLVFAVVTMWL